MAILNSIRKRGIFLVIIIALALFAFIVSDSLTKGGGGQDIQDTVATINGTDLSRQDFMGQVEAYQRSLGPNSTTAQAMNVIWERELRSTLMQQQVDELGITISEDQLKETLSNALANDPSFQDENGFYSEAKLIEYERSLEANNPQARSAKQNWLEYLENTKQSIMQNNYLAMVRGGLASTLAEGEQQYRFENDKINIEYVHIPYSKIADEDVVISEAEITAYIKANPTKFEVDPMVDIQYVSYLEEASFEDIEVKRTDVENMMEEFRTTEDYEFYVNDKSDNSYVDRWFYKNDLPTSIKDTIFTLSEGDVYGPYKVDNTFNLSRVVDIRQLPDSVKSRHILIPIGFNLTDSITRTKEQAKITADSILKVVRSNKSKFEDLVIKFTSDAGSKENGGRYDWYPYGQMVAVFRDFTFEQKTGDMGIVESQFGYHIIEVEGQKNMQKVLKVATVTKEIVPSEKTLSDVFSRGAKFEEAARDGDFNEIAEENGLTPKPVNKIGELDATLPGIGNNRTIINWAFQGDIKVGDVKRFNIGDTYVIAQLTRKNSEKALMSVAEASAIVTPILRNKKKALKIRESVSGNILEEVASSQNVVVKAANALTRSNPTIADAGTEPEVVGAAFGKTVGELTDLIDGENGVYMVQVLAVNKAPVLDNYEAYVSQLSTGAAGAINSSVYQALRKAADIEDNRAAFY
jgi:peptidyl-prolyl cis-trans isomerase D